MKSSTEKRLAKLREQETKIQEEIKKIEIEKEKELRKIQQKKEALIGAMVMAMMGKEQPITIASASDLLSLLDGFLNRKTDRTLFGLNSHDESTPNTPAHDATSPTPNQASQDSAPPTQPVTASPKEPASTQQDKTSEDEAPAAKTQARKTTKSKTRRTPAKRLPTNKKHNDIAEEFNNL